jgi:hypothetical protein
LNLFLSLERIYESKAMDFSQNRDAINKELEQFIQLLNETLPRYSSLLKKQEISSSELKELGDIEYFLIGVNAKITEIKKMLENDLFGHSIDLYYKLKKSAQNGDVQAQQKFETMRDAFNESLKGDTIVNWN